MRIFTTFILFLSMAAISCSGGAGSDLPNSFQVSIVDLVDSDMGYFEKPHEEAPHENGLVKYTWDDMGLMVVVFAQGKDTPISQINCVYLHGDTSSIGAFAGIPAIVNILNQGKEVVLDVNEIVGLVSMPIGSSIDYFSTRLTYANASDVGDGKQLKLIYLNPVE
jgi:hypothetical protein